MDSEHDDLDDVVVRRSASRPDITPEPNPGDAVSLPPHGQGDDVVLRSAGLVIDGERIAIPTEPLTIGSGYGVDVAIEGLNDEHVTATVESTADGHVLVATGDSVPILLNGEKLLIGERRPLGRADTVAIGKSLVHYVPSGSASPKLAPVTAIEAGRVRATGDEVLIGRGQDCGVRLDHPTVALHHARLVRRGGEANIEDISAGRGILVNGRRTNRARLSIGDQISVGPFRIVYDGADLIDRAAPTGLPVEAIGVGVDIVDGPTILQPTSLTLKPGELVAIIGESGAGKTTLLRALAGVSTPSRGQVLVGGEDVQLRLPEIGYVPQFDTVHQELTVTEVLDFAAQLRLPPDTSQGERLARVAEVIDQLGLSSRAELRVAKLSGGQRKRVAVGIELIRKPGAVFLDEPTTGLDPGLEHRLMKLFKSIAQDGQTVSLVTHATGSIALCDRVIVMGRGGVMMFDGPPSEMLAAFGVDSFDAIYPQLDMIADGTAARPERPVQPTISVAAPSAPATVRQREVEQGWLFQTQVLARRYATLILRDPRYLRSAFLQVPILAIFSALIMKSDVFARQTPEGTVSTNPDKAAKLIFIMVIISVWLGLINAAREIVKERAVASREFAIGVQIKAYFLSKLAVLFTIATAQTVLLVAIVFVLRPPHGGGGGALSLVIILSIGSWLAVILGLIVSAAASSEDQAVAVIPLLLVPQMLFAGLIVPYPAIPGALKIVASLAPTRWIFAAAGHALDMNARLSDVGQSGDKNPFGSFFDLTTFNFILVSLVFAAVLSAGVCYLLDRARQADGV